MLEWANFLRPRVLADARRPRTMERRDRPDFFRGGLVCSARRASQTASGEFAGDSAVAWPVPQLRFDIVQSRPGNLFKVRHRLGKYRIERKLAEGGFGVVYQALDTIEGVRVALKVPYAHLVDAKVLDDFRREVRLAARLDHVN